MAVNSLKITDDVGSEMLKRVRLMFNDLLDEISGAANFAALQTAVDANLKKVVAKLELPLAPTDD